MPCVTKPQPWQCRPAPTEQHHPHSPHCCQWLSVLRPASADDTAKQSSCHTMVGFQRKIHSVLQCKPTALQSCRLARVHAPVKQDKKLHVQNSVSRCARATAASCSVCSTCSCQAGHTIACRPQPSGCQGAQAATTQLTHTAGHTHPHTRHNTGKE
jgi:hypothetical protein